MDKRLVAFERLLYIMDELREKCPWDKKQTFETLRSLTIEETYELTDAIIEGDSNEIQGELGDLIMHIVFYSKIAEEEDQFSITEVLDGICDKLVYRHPHIYGDEKANTPEEVEKNWEELKLKKGRKSVLEGVPKSLPSLIKATRIQEKVKGVGFDWENAEQVWEKVEEEIAELKVEEAQNSDKVADEFGDVLFSLINYARFIHVDPAAALERTNKKFIRRFQHMEEAVKLKNMTLATLDFKAMNNYWEEAKKVKG